MVYILAVIVLLLSFICKKSKAQTFVITSFLLILFAFSSGNADYNVHLRRFTEYESLTSQTEMLFTALMYAFNKLGLSYRTFLMVTAIFSLTVFTRFVRRNTNYTPLVLALYLIYPFCMDVTMVRYTLGITVVYCGLPYLFQGTKQGIVTYCVYVVVATLIHFSAFFALLFVFPFLWGLKKQIRVMAVASACILVLSNALSLLARKLASLSFMNLGAKLNVVFNASKMWYDSQRIFRYGMKMLLILSFSLAIYYAIYKWMIKKCDLTQSAFKEKMSFILHAAGMNISLLPLIALLGFSADLFRLQLSLTLVNYVAYAQYFDIRDMLGSRSSPWNISKTTLVVSIGSVLLAFLGLYLWVLSSTNINTVFRPLFENNIFIH